MTVFYSSNDFLVKEIEIVFAHMLTCTARLRTRNSSVSNQIKELFSTILGNRMFSSADDVLSFRNEDREKYRDQSK